MSVKVAASQFKSIKEKKDLNINKAIDIAQQASKENVNTVSYTHLTLPTIDRV